MFGFPFVLDTKSSVESAVGVASATFGAMTVHKVYCFACNTNCWIKQDLTSNSPVASAGVGSAYVPANTPIMLDGSFGDLLAVIRDTADGKASLTPCVQTR